MKKIFSAVFIILFLLVACTNQAENILSLTPLPTIYKTLTPTSTKTPLILKTSSPAATFTPSKTPEPSATIHPGTIVAKTTLESLAQKFIDIDSSSGLPVFSPNGKWIAFQYYTNNQYLLRLISVDGKKNWSVSFYEIYGRDNDMETHPGDVFVGHWAKDGNYVYLEPHPIWDGPNLWFGNAADVIRFNLSNGTWVNLNIGNSYNFSPNDKYLVYSADDGVHLRTLFPNTEEVFPLPEKFETFGNYVWSPESDKVAFTATYGDWFQGAVGFSVILIDVKNSTIELLLEDDLRMYYPYEWTEDNKITFTRLDEPYLSYYFDLSTHEIILIPAP